MSMSASWKDISIDPDRLEWCPDDRVKVENGGTLLGEGTFGSVYRGEMDGGDVAIKVIKAQRGQPNERVSASRKAAEEQHAREIRRLMELRFRHVVQCYGVSPARDSSELLIITECLDGGSLHQSLDRARHADVPVTEISLLTICSHVAKGLRYIHNRYIHGDMKPHNVLLNAEIVIDSHNGVGYFPSHVEAKVADFGMSKRLKSDEHSLAMSTVEFGNQPFGTYAYMAPESFHGVRDLDDNALKAVDVFAFGVLVYEMLSGMSPWKYEGVTSPMQLQRLVVFEKRRPNWGTRVIKGEFRQLVERCWHEDSRCRPTAKELSVTFGSWLQEARQRDARSASSGNPAFSTSSFGSSLSSGASRGNGQKVAPPRLPEAPAIIRQDSEPSEFVRVQSSNITREELRSQGRVANGPENPPVLPMSPPPNEPTVATTEPTSPSRTTSETEPVGKRVTAANSSDGRVSEEGEPEAGRSDSDKSSGSGDGNVRDLRVDGSGTAASGSAASGSGKSSRSSDDEAETAEKRRNYWEKRGPSVKHSMPMQPMGSSYDIGDSVANEIRAPATSTGAPSLSLPDAGSNGLDFTMAGIAITRVETQYLNEPDRPGLDLPVIANLPAGNQVPKGNNAFLDNSMLDAVNEYNANAGVGGAGTNQPAVGGMVERFEALNKQRTRPGESSGQDDGNRHRCVVSTPASADQAAAMAAMGLELPSKPGPSHRRTVSSPEGEISEADRKALANSDVYNTAKASDEHEPSPSNHAPVQPSSSQSGPPRGQTMPLPQSLAVHSQQPSTTSSTFANIPSQVQQLQQLSIGDVLQALQAPDGSARVRAWWEEGHAVVIASAIARENQKIAGASRLELLVELLQKVTASQGQVKSATNANVARDLCIALGNASRGGSIDRESAELSLPLTLTTMQAFTYDMSVYSAACYALANVLKVSNDIASDRVRADVADWISHATSFNLNNKRGGPEPTLAYTTAAAARNFIWRKAANAEAFFTRRRAKTALHPSAAENMCASMLFFQKDPTVVEACLSAYAALAYFASHRLQLIKIGVVTAVARVMDRPTNQQNAALLTMGLATLGIIVGTHASTVETDQLVEAFIKEGGVGCVVKVLGGAVRARNSRVMEEGLYAMASISRFDDRLGRTVVHTGGASYVIQAVFCNVESAPEQVTVRSAEVMCDVVDVLSQHAAAASHMRQTRLSSPLQTLVSRFSMEPKVTGPGRRAIARIQ